MEMRVRGYEIVGVLVSMGSLLEAHLSSGKMVVILCKYCYGDLWISTVSRWL